MSFVSIIGDEFIIDSGCTNHMMHSYASGGEASDSEAGGRGRECGTKYKPIHGKFVRVANGHKLAIAGRFDLGGMTGILHVPDIARNLLSVRQLAKDGYKIIFSEDKVHLEHRMFAQPIEIGTLSNNLYVASADLHRLTQPAPAETFLAENQSEMDVFVTRRWDPVVDPNTPSAFIPNDLIAVKRINHQLPNCERSLDYRSLLSQS